MVTTVALSLISANIYGYTKCDKDSKKKMKDMMASGVGAAMNTSIGQNIASGMLSAAMGGITGGGARSQAWVLLLRLFSWYWSWKSGLSSYKGHVISKKIYSFMPTTKFV